MDFHIKFSGLRRFIFLFSDSQMFSVLFLLSFRGVFVKTGIAA